MVVAVTVVNADNSPSVNAATRAGLALWLRLKLARDVPRPSSSPPKTTLPTDRVKIAAVQWNADPVRRVQDWSERVQALFRQASRTHCHLLVFPEYLPLSLLGAVMPSTNAVNTLTDTTIRALLRSLAPATFRHWYRWMSALSRQYRIVTVAGSGLTVHRGQLVNVAVGFDADGVERMWQPKWHPLPDELRWGVAKGQPRPLDVLNPWGLCTMVCNDASYYESFRMAEALQVRIATVPIADPDPRYTEGKARRGCFSRVQDVPMVGVVAASTGRLFGLRLTGKAGIYLPAELTPDGTGVLAESSHPVGEGIVSAVVSLTQVEEFQRDYQARHPVPPPEFLEALYQFEED